MTTKTKAKVTPKKTGRDTKCTEPVIEAICDAVKLGQPLYRAALCVDIDRATIHRWQVRGEKGIEPFATFCNRLRRAEAQGELAAIRTIHAAAVKDWTAHKFWLQARFNETWGRKDVLPATDPETNREDVLRALLAALQPANKQKSRRSDRDDKDAVPE